MIAWLSANYGWLIILAALAVAVAAIVASIVRGKKRGKHLCGGDCSSCASGCAYASRCPSAKKYTNPFAACGRVKTSVRQAYSERRRSMTKTTLKIDGMMCSMCEAHINDAIRAKFPVKKVTSSHKTGVTEIVSEDPLDESALRSAVGETGYRVESVSSEPYEKKKFSLFGRK